MTIPPGGSKSNNHIQILDFLRGLAALSVVFFHFSGSALPTIKPNFVTDFFSWGKLGVQVFFVISGFIIPYAMHKGGYTLKGAGAFILKRIIRIGPPSWIALLLIVAIYYGGIFLNGRPIEGMPWPGVDLRTIVANLTYMYSFLDAGKYNEVYWTLEIEFQFYIVIALIHPLLSKFSGQPVLLSGLLLLLSCTYFIHNDEVLFFKDNSYFILGILLYLFKTGQITKNYFSYSTMAAMLICYAQQDLTSALAGIVSFLVIAYVRFSNPVTTFLGTISYSLYITHHFTGIISEFVLRNLTGMSPSMPVKTLMVFVYAGLAVCFAWLFYRFIEKPFIHLSHPKKKITQTAPAT